MWSTITSTCFWFGVLGCYLLLSEGFSITGLIKKRRKRLANLRADAPTIPDPPQLAESIESKVFRTIANLKAEGIQHQVNKAVIFLCCFGLMFSFGAHAGYIERDLEAYSDLHTYPNISWQVERSYLDPRFPSGNAHDILQLPNGPETKGFVTCEKQKWQSTIIDGMAFYYRNGCASFDGPKAWLLTHFVEQEIAGQ